MKILLLFVAAQLAGNSLSLLIGAAVWHFTRPRLVDIGKTARRDGVGYAIEVEPC
jgi:hypothetical protein